MPIPSWKSGLQEIAANVFAYVHSGVGWDICNSGFVVGEDGVMVIDAMMAAGMVDPYIEEIRKVTNKPIRYVVNTHHHVDHSFGNQFYLPTEVVSHQKCREAMLMRGADVNMLSERWPQYREDWVKTRLTPATITYEDKMIVHLGDRVIELLHPGPAHTYGDTLVYLPQERVLFSGDVAFHYLTPLARVAPTPALQPTHQSYGASMLMTQGHRHCCLRDSGYLIGVDQGESNDSDRDQTATARLIPKLAELVQSPAHDFP